MSSFWSINSVKGLVFVLFFISGSCVTLWWHNNEREETENWMRDSIWSWIAAPLRATISNLKSCRKKMNPNFKSCSSVISLFHRADTEATYSINDGWMEVDPVSTDTWGCEADDRRDTDTGQCGFCISVAVWSSPAPVRSPTGHQLRESTTVSSINDADEP